MLPKGDERRLLLAEARAREALTAAMECHRGDRDFRAAVERIKFSIESSVRHALKEGKLTVERYYPHDLNDESVMVLRRAVEELASQNQPDYVFVLNRAAAPGTTDEKHHLPHQGRAWVVTVRW